MANNDFEWHEDPFHITRNGSRLLDHLDLTNQASVGCIDFDQVSLTDSRFLNEFEPVSGGPIQGFTFPWNQGWDDLVEDRYLIRKSKLIDVFVIGRPHLLDFALVEHFSHGFQCLKSAFEHFTRPNWVESQEPEGVFDAIEFRSGGLRATDGAGVRCAHTSTHVG